MKLENKMTKIDKEKWDIAENDWDTESVVCDEITEDKKTCAMNIIPDQGNYIQHKTLF